MQTVMDEDRLKQVFKEGLVEMLKEKQNLFQDIALTRAIQKGRE